MKFSKYIYKHTNEITIASAILIGIAFAGHLLGNESIVATFFLIASIIAATPIILKAVSALRYRVIGIELLVSIAVIGAILIGEFEESAIVTFLFLFGTFLEEKTLGKTRNSIKALTDLAPKTATLVTDDGEVEEDVDFIDEGDVVIVKTGNQIPVDGRVIEGTANVNEASVTGESKLVEKTTGSDTFAGTIVDNGTIKIETTKAGEDTTFGKIVELVEEAQDTKSHAEKFIDHFAKYYTPAVLIIAFVVWLITRDVPLAITVLVLGCPGALVIGAPVSSVAGIGNGAHNGALIKGGEVMDTLSKADVMAFDKTGTLTKGHPEVVSFKNYEVTDGYLGYLAQIERQSEHPLAKAIADYLDSQKTQTANQLEKVASVDTIKGKGVRALIDSGDVLIGNPKLLADYAINLSSEQRADYEKMTSAGQSVSIATIAGKVSAMFGIADAVRPEVKEELATLKEMGIKQLVMLTGDNAATAQIVADQLGIDEVHAELLPDEKVEYVKKMQADGLKVVFVGDGINDSPSLVTADIGIAMGAGTDVAIETSDVVLMSSKFGELVHAYGISKQTVRNTWENIVIAVGTVAFLLVGLIFGYIYMASGMFVHEASILVVIFNAMRLIKYRPKSQQVDKNLMQVNLNESGNH